MNRQDEIEIQLWEYIDGTCSDADRAGIAKLIATDNVWQTLYEDLLLLHQSILADAQLDEPSMRFTKNVMDVVAATNIAPATKKYINYGVIKGIAAVFFIIIAGLLAVAFSATNWSLNTEYKLPELHSSIHFTQLLSGPFFIAAIAVNVILGLLLFDSLLRKRIDSARLR